MPSQARAALVFASAFAVLAACNDSGFWAFALRHPAAFDSRSASLLLSHGVWPLLLAGGLAAACAGLGRLLLPLLGGAALSHPARAAASPALGAGLCACVALGLGLAGLLSPGPLAAAAGLAALLGWPRAAWGLRDAAARGGAAPGATPLWKALLAGLLAYAGWHALVVALAPPTDWDVLAYHLALPKIYLAEGRLLELPWLLHSHWPHLMEVLWTGFLAAGRPESAAVFHAAAAAGLCAAVLAAGREELGERPAWLAAALVAAQPALLRLSGTAHSDGFTALYSFLASWAAWRWLKSGGAGLAALAGLLAGLAAASKLLAWAQGAALLAALLAWPAGLGRAERRRGAAVFAAAFLLPALPWLLKSWAWAGDPVWPFLPRFFGARWGAELFEAAYRRSNRLAWPVDWAAVLRYGPQHLLLPCAGLALLARRGPSSWPPFARFLLALSLPAALLLGRHREFWRFFLPHYPALALLAADQAERALAGGVARRAGAWALLALGLWPLARAEQNNQLFAVLAPRSVSEPARDPRELYLERSLDHYAFFRAASRAVGPEARILLFREIRGYHLDAPYLWGDPLNQGLLAYDRMKDPEELGRALRDLGATHVLVNEGPAVYAPGGPVYSPRTAALMAGFLAGQGRRVLASGPLSLYSLEY